MALGTHKSGLLPIVSTKMLVIDDTIGEYRAFSNTLAVKVAVKIYPLTAILGPGLASKCFPKSRCHDLGF